MKNSSKLLLSFCLSAIMVASCGCNQTSSDSQSSVTGESVAQSTADSQKATELYDGGSGTKADPYLIANAQSLSEFAKNVNSGLNSGYAEKYFKLTADIDLKGNEWTPIGNMNDKEKHTTMFLGTFDGDNHTISNLNYISDEFNCGAGLFGVNCGEVKNLVLENVNVSVTDEKSLASGGAIGYNMGIADNITLCGDSTITGNNCTGGIVGGNNNKVINCKAENVTVVVIGDNKFTDNRIIQADVAECGGLIIGGGFGGTIDNCSASGTVKADGNEPVGLGGIGGCLEMMDSITNCTADVKIQTTKGGHAIGGLCGYAGTHSNLDICLETEGFSTKNYPSVIDNCKVTVSINSKDSTHVGGLVGTGLYYYGEETAFKITNCSVQGEINGAVTPGAIAGRAEKSVIESCTTDVKIDGKKLKIT